MDSFYDDLPSTSQSAHMSGHEDSQGVSGHHVTLETQDPPNMVEDTDSSVGKSTSMTMMSEIKELHTSSSIDDISRRVQELVEKINDSRASDQKVLDSFQEKLEEKVTETCQQMKENMYMVYEENSNEMQVKLQELSEVLERCTKLNSELLEATQGLRGCLSGP